jgi:hypothetical protein
VEYISILSLSQKLETVHSSKMLINLCVIMGSHIQGHGIMVNKFVMLSLFQCNTT